MKRLILTFFSFFLFLALQAQTSAAEELKNNPNLSASNMVAYQEPTCKLTPAPKGWHPFYLSHYGRHGSRYMTKLQDYEYALGALERASLEKKLTPLGEDVLQRVRKLHSLAQNHMGDLTSVGVRQQKTIGRRMVENFGEIFLNKHAYVDARSTLVPRCILSMEHLLQQLLVMNPRLRIDHDASVAYMHYLNHQDSQLMSKVQSAETRTVYSEFCDSLRPGERMVSQLFSDTAYMHRVVNAERLHIYLFHLAGSVQDTELEDSMTLYDLFTPEEILADWQMENAFWFLGYGSTAYNGGRQPFTQRNLLRRIIAEADSCLQLPHPGATLRFGHETIVLPLVCLMGLNGADVFITSLDSLEAYGLVNYRIFPMSSNIQLVFYRKNVADEDILLKVLLNEKEATLPVKSSMAPYYRWQDVRSYYLKKLDSYAEEP